MPDPKNPQPDGASELPEELTRRIDALHARLAGLDHFSLLGLSRDATRAQVRHAFLALAPQFHPDKYFGKKLGPYAAKMQRVFAHMSEAHDTLVNDELRAEYARTLPSAPPPPPAVPARQPSSPETSEGRIRVTTSRPPGPLTPEAAAAEARARQQAFASRLAGHSSARVRAGAPLTPGNAQATPGKPFAAGTGPRQGSSPGIGVRPSSPGVPAVDSKAAVDSLRRRYEDSVAHARGKQTIGNVHAAEAAAAKGDFVEAAKLYRAATEHSSDANLRAVLVQTETKAKEQGHAQALQMAKDSEEKQDYAAAAAAWARAFELVAMPETAHRASLCFRRAGTDGRRAAHYGEEAVKIDPQKAAYRVNLALVYADLGLFLRARGEIDRAHALEPQSAPVKDAMTRIKAMK